MSNPVKRWSKEEIDVLLMYVILDHRNRVANLKELEIVLDRSSQSISDKIKALRKKEILPPAIVKRPVKFTDEEVVMLVCLRGENTTVKEMANKLGRSEAAISDKLNSMSIPTKKRDWWSPEEEKTLLETVRFDEQGRTQNLDELSKVLNRSEKSIKIKIFRMRRKNQIPEITYLNHQVFLPWTSSEEKRFIYLWRQNETIESISKEMDRSENAVYTKSNQLKALGVINRRHHPWTSKEIAFILDNVIYDELDNIINISEISRELSNHSIDSLKNKISELRKEGKVKKSQGIHASVRDKHNKFNQLRFAHLIGSESVNAMRK